MGSICKLPLFSVATDDFTLKSGADYCRLSKNVVPHIFKDPGGPLSATIAKAAALTLLIRSHSKFWKPCSQRATRKSNIRQLDVQSQNEVTVSALIEFRN